MGVGLRATGKPRNPARLNTLFVRYGCGTRRDAANTAPQGLNTLFVRYGCGTAALPGGVRR